MKIGRNEPCRCGSGQKYKRCCLAKDQVASIADHQWKNLRRTEGRVVELLLYVAHEWYGPDFIKHAWTEYTADSPAPLSMEQAPEAETSFIPWALFDYLPREPEGEVDQYPVPLAFSFLMNADKLEPLEKQFILEAIRQPKTFWMIEEADPGKSLKLRDLFTQTEHTVREQKASEVLTRGDIVFTRVIALDNTAIMFGMAPLPFPPDFQLTILDARENIFGQRRKLSMKNLITCEAVMRQLYFILRDRLLNPQLPKLQNTDGDPLKFVKLSYQLRCTPQTAFDKLRTLNPIESEEELLAEATRDDENGALERLEFSWMKKGNQKHRSWDNTILGNLTIENGMLIVEVNSVQRSDTIQSEIAKRLGEDAVLENITCESIEEQLARSQDAAETDEQRQQREEQKAFASNPEVQALMKEQAKRHWEQWVNEPIPLLRGKTPTQAAKTAGGRERLEALLTDFERKAGTDESVFAPDWLELRRRLGMLPGMENYNSSQGNRRKSSTRTAVPLYQLKITLRGSQPPIWRRFVVRSDMPLNRLHVVIQRVMGWTDSHLHQFVAGSTIYGIPDPEMIDFGGQILNEKRYTLVDLVPTVKSSFVYEYDFGDGWQHKVGVEKILPPDPEFQHPLCLAGANACPPEDCGGIGGYYEMTEILADQTHPERGSFSEWLGYDFDPTWFDLNLTNQVLRRLKA